MSAILYHANYNEQFFCQKNQVEMFDSIRKNNTELFNSILEAVAAKKGDNKERDVMVTIFFSRDEHECPRTCTAEQFKLIKSFNTPSTSTCPSIHSGMLSGWVTENVFVVGQQ